MEALNIDGRVTIETPDGVFFFGGLKGKPTLAFTSLRTLLAARHLRNLPLPFPADGADHPRLPGGITILLRGRPLGTAHYRNRSWKIRFTPVSFLRQRGLRLEISCS